VEVGPAGRAEDAVAERGHQVALPGGLEVAAGAERLLPGAREDADERGVVLAEPRPRVAQLVGGPGCHGVHPFRPVDRDDGDGAVLLVADVLVVHGEG
jgi:hypothetical protein